MRVWGAAGASVGAHGYVSGPSCRVPNPQVPPFTFLTTHRLLPKCQGPPAVASDACPVPTLPRGRNVARGWASRSVRQGEVSEHRLHRCPLLGPGGGARTRACSPPHPASPNPRPGLRTPSACPLPCGLGHQPSSCSWHPRHIENQLLILSWGTFFLPKTVSPGAGAQQGFRKCGLHSAGASGAL